MRSKTDSLINGQTARQTDSVERKTQINPMRSVASRMSLACETRQTRDSHCSSGDGRGEERSKEKGRTETGKEEGRGHERVDEGNSKVE